MSSEPRTARGLEDVAPQLHDAMMNFMAVAYPGTVDIVTRELVRIYSGRESHCRICRNFRLRVAIDRGFDESMVDQLDDLDHSDLAPHQKAALRLAHAFLGDPHGFTPDARAELFAHFTPEQAAELVLDLVRYRPGSKLTVVAGDEPAEEGLIFS
jgi:alkylhydroperoxidase family enzyme